MRVEFVLRDQDRDVIVDTKVYMSEAQAFNGFKKAARNYLGDFAYAVKQETLEFGEYYRDHKGDVLEMRRIA